MQPARHWLTHLLAAWLALCTPLARYDIYTYSRPHHPLAFLGYPVVRVLQQRFRSESMRAVARAAACQVGHPWGVYGCRVAAVRL